MVPAGGAPAALVRKEAAAAWRSGPNSGRLALVARDVGRSWACVGCSHMGELPTTCRSPNLVGDSTLLEERKSGT